MAPNENDDLEKDLAADLTDPARLYKNREEYPELMEDIRDEFGEVTLETCEKALEEIHDDFVQIRKSN